MCFLPSKLLKLLVGVGAVLSLLLSLALLTVTIVANFEMKDITDHVDEKVIDTLLVGLYVLAVLFMLLAICGIYGSIKVRRKNSKLGSCLLSIYFVGVAIFLLSFIAGTILLFAAPSSLFGGDCTHGSKTHFVKEMFDLNNLASQNFCTVDCPCYIEPNNSKSALVGWLKDHERNYTDIKKDGFVNYQNCATEKLNEESVLLFGALEKLLTCSGWCKDEAVRFSKFSNINKCVTADCIHAQTGCYDAFKDFLVSHGNMMGVACLVGSLVCLVNMVMICCICYHPDNSGRKRENFYSRMLEN